ncbi:MAG TPA: T9SS type A sorting domain-containing protein [Saprospiraceae bacterium]|nr:T9SS type A sorting domain-containing protein [Saprospiraceae bacterium]
MKTLLRTVTLLALFFLINQASAQTYFFSVESAEYEPIQGGQALVDGVWDDPDLSIPIGFSFELFSRTIQELSLRSNFNIITLSENTISNTYSLLLLFGADLVDRGLGDSIHLSPITRKLEGNVGSRVMTVEWENAGFFGELLSNGTTNDFVNFQMKLYEASGDIVYHFGPSSVTMPGLAYSGQAGPTIGIAEDYDGDFDIVNGEIILLSDDPSDPGVNTDYMNYFLNATIPENTVYRFSREPVGTTDPEVVRGENYFYPNPTTGTLTLQSGLQGNITFPLSVYAHDGRLVKQLEAAGSYELNDLPSGLYEIRFESNGKMAGQRIFLLED